MSTMDSRKQSFFTGAGIWLPLTLAAGLIVRIIGFLSLRNAMFAGMPSFNDYVLRERTASLLMGQMPEQVLPWGSPLYPYFTALVQTIFGESHTPVFVLQALFGVATSILLAWALAPVLAARTRWIAAFLYAINPIAVWLELRWQPLALSMLLLVIVLRLLFYRSRKQTALGAASGGLVLGAGFLLQPLMFFALAIAALWRSIKKESAPATTIIMMVCFLVLPLFICVQNQGLPEGRFTWNRSGAFDFYQSLQQETWGTPRSITPPAWAGPTTAEAIAHGATGESMTDGEIIGYFLTTSFSQAAEGPIRFVGQILRKAGLLLTGHEVPDPVSPGFVLSRSAPALMWGLWLFPVILVLALLGGWIRRERNGLTLFLFPLSALAAVNLLGLYSSASRWPLVLLLLPLAAVGIEEAKRLLPSKSDLPRYLLPALLGIAVLSYLDLPKVCARLDNSSEDLRYAAALVLKKFDASQAMQFARDAIAADHNNAAAHTDLAKLLIAEDLVDAAQREYEQALAIDPETEGALFGLSELLRAQNMFKEAEEYAGKLLMLHPYNPLYLNQLAAILMLQNRFGEARMLLHAALKLMPDYEVARINLEEIEKIETNAAQLAFPPELSPQPDTAMMELNVALMAAQNSSDLAAMDSLTLHGLNQFPEAPFVHYMRGFCLLMLGRLDDALPMLERAVEEVPGRFVLTQTAVRTLLSLNRSDEAMVLLQQNIDQAATEANRVRLTNFRDRIEEQIRIREAQGR
jgi:tetratricopeptide (TPR) repeat protein